jgi:hypothetical protein
MIKIHKDYTVKQNRYYAVTNKGILYGGSPEIVQRKIDRLGAKEETYNSDIKTIADNNSIDTLPF